MALWSLDVSNPWPEVAKIAYQGLPGLVENKRFALKGLETRTRSGSKVPGRLSPYPVAPSGLIRVGRTTQGKPWATLFRPLRATDGRMTDEAKILRRDLL